MVRAKVKLNDQDPNLTYAKTLSVDVGFKHLKTPSRALHLKQSPQCESRLITTTSVRGINEIYIELSKDKIFLIDNDEEKLIEFTRNLRYIFQQEKVKDELNLLFFGYKNKHVGSKKNSVPTDKEIEYICNIISHPSSDVIIPPVIEGLKGDDYLEFLKKFFMELKSFKKNPEIMGFFPFVSTSDIRKIGSFYVNKGVNMYSVDFNGTNPLDFYPVLHEVHKFTNFMDKEFKTDCYVHGFNVPITRVQPKTRVGSAKDILTFAMGLDSFGTNHRPSKMPIEVIEKLKKKFANKPKLPVKPLPIHYRLFNRNDYGYYKLEDAKKEFSETDSPIIKINDLTNKKLSPYKLEGLRKSFNVERQALESLELRTQIKERSLKPYWERKKYSSQNLSYIMRVFN